MYSTITLLVFLAFLLLYNLSKKSHWENKPAWAKRIEKDKVLSRSLSFFIMGISLLLLTFLVGIGSAIFTFLVILMAMGSLIVLLNPFQYLSAKHLVVLYVICLVFEFIIF